MPKGLPGINSFQKKGFTLIELLVVIAIIAILAVVVVLVLNPAQLLAQSRDSNRVSDLSTISSALSLYQTDQSDASGYTLGNASSVYMSYPDASSTCGDLSLPTLPSGYTWGCSSASNYRITNNTGWIPVNFSSISSGAPFGSLPIDPTNSTSSGLYYTYTTSGSQYELTAAMESSKYQKGGSGDVISGDGASLSTVYAKGTNLALEPLDYGSSGGPRVVGSADCGGGATNVTSFTCAYTPVAANDLLVVGCRANYSITPGSGAISTSPSYATTKDQEADGTAGPSPIWLGHFVPTATTPVTVTCSWTSATSYPTIILVELSGMTNATAGGLSGQNTGSITSLTTPAFSTTASSYTMLFVSGGGDTAPVTTGAIAGQSATLIQGSGGYVMMEGATLPGIATNQTANISWTGASSMSYIVQAYGY